LECVHQVGPFERYTAAFSNSLELFQLSFRQGACVMEETPDKGGLAVVDMADDDNL
jgi:hypothetical protein